MTTLVTGGAGFIGGHLIEQLVADGEHVVVLDDFSTGSERNLLPVAGSPLVRVVRGSILDADLVDRLTAGVDTVYHLAAAVGVFSILDNPLQSLRTNLHGTENVVVSAHRHDARLLLASTSEVYGKNTAEGLREDDDRIIGSPLKSRWSYAEAKAIDETLAYTYAVEHGLRAVIVRLFNTVGPRQTGRYGMVVPRFVAQALAGEPITVFGPGTQERCFCHVLDVVPALRTLVDDTGAYGQVFNLGSSERVSIEMLARRVIERTASSSTVVHVPYEQAYTSGYEDMQRRVPDCSRARAQIGFAPTRSLDHIIDDVVADLGRGLSDELASEALTVLPEADALSVM
jgi:UDP-glucose 4-epimerase